MNNSITLQDAVCQSDNLCRAFARYRNQRGLWAPKVPMSRVAGAPLGPMLELAEVLRSGDYNPHPPHTLRISKANGEQRELKVFCMRDRIVQRALLQVLQARTDAAMSPFSFGYRPGRGVQQALQSLRRIMGSGLSWVLDADIEHCFDSIPRAPLLEQVTRRTGDPAAARWVSRCMGWTDDTVREGAGIAQGAVLSPWLCNIYLWQLDDCMRAAAVAMVRFADDFVLLAGTRRVAEQAWQRCAEAVQAMRLRLHPAKTALVEASQPFRFLGQWMSLPRLLPSPRVSDCG